jgi:hypothetical protein
MTEDKPTPAEAATEVGSEEPDFYSRELMLKEAAEFALSVLVIFAAVLCIALLVGYFV